MSNVSLNVGLKERKYLCSICLTIFPNKIPSQQIVSLNIILGDVKNKTVGAVRRVYFRSACVSVHLVNIYGLSSAWEMLS